MNIVSTNIHRKNSEIFFMDNHENIFFTSLIVNIDKHNLKKNILDIFDLKNQLNDIHVLLTSSYPAPFFVGHHNRLFENDYISFEHSLEILNPKIFINDISSFSRSSDFNSLLGSEYLNKMYNLKFIKINDLGITRRLLIGTSKKLDTSKINFFKETTLNFSEELTFSTALDCINCPRQKIYDCSQYCHKYRTRIQYYDNKKHIADELDYISQKKLYKYNSLDFCKTFDDRNFTLSKAKRVLYKMTGTRPLISQRLIYSFDLSSYIYNEIKQILQLLAPEIINYDSSQSITSSKSWDWAQPHTKAKINIIVDFFKHWSNTPILKNKNLAYIDYCAGAGKFNDGYESTPLKILREATNYKSKKKIDFIFFEKDTETRNLLEANIEDLKKSIDLKMHKITINDKYDGIESIQHINLDKYASTLHYLDPYGYKILKFSDIQKMTDHANSSCLLFFSFDGIVRGFGNDNVDNTLLNIFQEKFYPIKNEILNLKNTPACLDKVALKEELIITGFEELFSDRYCVSFPIQYETTQKTSHYLIYITKNYDFFDKMKSTMWNVGDNHFGYVNPSVKSIYEPFNINKLKDEIYEDNCNHIGFISVENVIKDYTEKTIYTSHQVLECLGTLKTEGKIKIQSGKQHRSGVTHKSHIKFV